MNPLNKYMIKRDDAPEGLTLPPILPNWLKPFKPSEVRLPPIANLFNELGIARPRAPEVPSDRGSSSTPISGAMAPYRPHGLDRPIHRQSRLCGRPLKWYPTGYLRLQLDIDQHNGCQPHGKVTENRFIAYSAIGGHHSTDKAAYEAFTTKGVDEAEDNERKSTGRLVDIVDVGKGVRSDGRNNQVVESLGVLSSCSSEPSPTAQTPTTDGMPKTNTTALMSQRESNERCVNDNEEEEETEEIVQYRGIKREREHDDMKLTGTEKDEVLGRRVRQRQV